MPFLVLLRFFCFRARNPHGTDGRTDGRTDGQDPQCGFYDGHIIKSTMADKAAC